MTITATIAMMGGASLACMAVEKIAYECNKQNIAGYASLFTSASLGVIALRAGLELVKFIATI